MKKALFLAILAVFSVLPTPAFAAWTWVASVHAVVTATSESYGGQANWVTVSGLSLPSACGSGGGYPSGLYIEYADKEMFALAMSSQLNGSTVSFYYDASAPSRNTLASVTTCKIVFLQQS